MAQQHNIQQTVDHLFRNEHGKVVALLANKYGASHFETIEDVVQDTFIKAMQVWGYQAVPDNPTAWLYRVANNAMIDGLRRAKKFDLGTEPNNSEAVTQTSDIATDSEPTDSQLKLIFACCDPSLSEEYQLVLSLKIMGGFSNRELAEALLKKEETVAKSYTRAKKKFREQVRLPKFPVELGLQSRLFVVLRVIYLLFSEGYAVTSGTLAIKRDICYEALRLALLLRKNTYCQHEQLDALIALMCFHAARFDARIDPTGNLVTLAEHDRSLYNTELIEIGTFHLEKAGAGKGLTSRYHLEAAVSYYHSAAETYAETDWGRILQLYDLHLQRNFSPIVALNRIVAYQRVHGAAKALKVLNELASKNDYSKTSLYFAIRGELLLELGQKTFAASIEKAIALSENELVKKHLAKK